MNLRGGFFRLWIVFSVLWVGACVAFGYSTVWDRTEYVYYVPGGDVADTKGEMEKQAKGKCVGMVTDIRDEIVDMGDHVTVVLPTLYDKQTGKYSYMADCDATSIPSQWRWVAWDDEKSNRVIASGIRPKAQEIRTQRLKAELLNILAFALGAPMGVLLIGKLFVWVAAGFREEPPPS